MKFNVICIQNSCK